MELERKGKDRQRVKEIDRKKKRKEKKDGVRERHTEIVRERKQLSVPTGGGGGGGEKGDKNECGKKSPRDSIPIIIMSADITPSSSPLEESREILMHSHRSSKCGVCVSLVINHRARNSY